MYYPTQQSYLYPAMNHCMSFATVENSQQNCFPQLHNFTPVNYNTMSGSKNLSSPLFPQGSDGTTGTVDTTHTSNAAVTQLDSSNEPPVSLNSISTPVTYSQSSFTTAPIWPVTEYLPSEDTFSSHSQNSDNYTESEILRSNFLLSKKHSAFLKALIASNNPIGRWIYSLPFPAQLRLLEALETSPVTSTQNLIHSWTLDKNLQTYFGSSTQGPSEEPLLLEYIPSETASQQSKLFQAGSVFGSDTKRKRTFADTIDDSSVVSFSGKKSKTFSIEQDLQTISHLYNQELGSVNTSDSMNTCWPAKRSFQAISGEAPVSSDNQFSFENRTNQQNVDFSKRMKFSLQSPHSTPLSPANSLQHTNNPNFMVRR